MAVVTVTVHVDGFPTTVTCSNTALDAVLFSFNPSSDRNVADLKALCAALITKMEHIRDGDALQAQKRNASVAITEAEAVQMRAVKALFAK